MSKLLALFWFAATLAGCDPHGHTMIVQSVVDGRAVLHSEVDIVRGVASFRCIASSSGTCHYAIYADDCHGSAACLAKPLHQFELPVGQRLIDAGQPPGFISCVGVDIDTSKAACPDDGQPVPGTAPGKHAWIR